MPRFDPNQSTALYSRQPTGRCIVDGCPCKDARIVSQRVATFWRELAQSRGETADRVIPARPKGA